jgi:hypothetical protein
MTRHGPGGMAWQGRLGSSPAADGSTAPIPQSVVPAYFRRVAAGRGWRLLRLRLVEDEQFRRRRVVAEVRTQCWRCCRGSSTAEDDMLQSLGLAHVCWCRRLCLVRGLALHGVLEIRAGKKARGSKLGSGSERLGSARSGSRA